MNVSVIIPVYNAEKFLLSAVQSALAHEEVKEVILIEDGSLDRSLLICQQLEKQYNKVKLFRHEGEKNLGAGASRNLGIAKAAHEYISFLDADDFFTEIRFEKEKEIFSKYLDCDGVYGAIGVEYFDKAGAKAWTKKGWDESTLTTVSKPVRSEHLFEYLIGFRNADNYNGHYSIDSFTVKRDILIGSKIQFDETLRLHQDTVFLWQCAYKLKLLTGDYQNAIAKRTVHSGNRFIHNRNWEFTQLLMYKVLLNWGEKENIEKDYIGFFSNKLFVHLFLYSSPTNVLMNYFKYLSTIKSFRKNSTLKQFLRVIRKTVIGR